MDTSEQLTAPQVKAVEALLTKPTIKAAAKACGVPYTTLRRWMRNLDFKAALAEAQGETLAQTLRGLAALSAHALEKLAKLVDSKDPKISLAAVRVVLSQLVGFRETERKADDVMTPAQMALFVAQIAAIIQTNVHDPATRQEIIGGLSSLVTMPASEDKNAHDD
jgi:transposase-like protein